MALITDLDDRTLVEQHRSGDPDAFRRIVVRHHRSLYANALRRLGDPVAAEDAVQDAFLRAFRNIERFDGDYHLDAWLHRIVTNTCHDIGRRRGRDTRLFDRACTEVEVEVAPADETVLAGLPRQEITDALDSLPESYREVLILRFVDELSYSDVAEQAGISEQNARARVSRGRNMLKRMLTSTSALVVWAIAPLRRQAQLSGAEAEAANQAANQVHGLATIASTAPAPTQAFTQLSGIIAQAGPTIATAAPSVSSAAPTLGKAAVAVGLAAAAAIPTGVAVDRARQKPPAPIAAENEDETAAVAPDAPVTVDVPKATPPTTAGAVVAAAAVVEPTLVGGTGDEDVASDNVTAPSTSVAPPASETEDPASIADGEGSAEEPAAPAPAPTTDAEEPPSAAPVAGPPGQLSASVAITPAGNRLQIDGPLKLEIDDEVIAGRLSGKLLVGDAGKDPEAPREVQRSELLLDLEDGTQLVLVVRGFSTVTTEDGSESHALDLTYTLDRAAEYGLADGGDLEGTLVVTGDRGELGLAIPGATETS